MIPLLQALDRAAGWLAAVAAALSAVILAGVTAHILLEIVLRNVFSTSTYAVDELVGYGVGAMTILALAQTFRRGEMIRVQLVIARLPPAARRAVEVLCALLALVPVALAGRAFILGAERSFREHAVSTGLLEVPLWIPEAIFAAGLVLLGVQLILYAARLCIDASAPFFESDVTTD